MDCTITFPNIIGEENISVDGTFEIHRNSGVMTTDEPKNNPVQRSSKRKENPCPKWKEVKEGKFSSAPN